MAVFDRETGEEVPEVVPAWLAVGIRAMTVMPSAVARGMNAAMTSYCGAAFDDPAKAKEQIQDFIRRYGIDVKQAAKPPSAYRTMNAFFQRKLRPGIRPIAASGLVVPADCRLTAYASVAQGKRFWVKGDEFSVSRLLGAAGTTVSSPAIVFCRLAPQDYHRFHLPAGGVLSDRVDVSDGIDLFSVNPASVHDRKMNVFTRNKRAFWTLKTRDMGTIVIVAVGATCTGSIVTIAAPGRRKKGAELGMFGFGGSTVILMVDPKRVRMDDDLLRRSKRGEETLVRMGQSLGARRSPNYLPDP
jgi:phosphatidylserine decarboxylase